MVDQVGQLVTFAIDRDGGVSGPAEAGPKAVTIWGAPLAASRQFGAGQTDLFVVDKNGQVKVVWRKDGGAWSGPANIGPEDFTAKFAHLSAGRLGKGDRTGLFAVDKQGALAVFRAEKNGPWTGPQTIGEAGFAPAGAPIAVFEAEERTFLFLVDKRGQPHMAVAESDGGFGAPKPIGPKDIAPAGAPLAVVGRARAPQFALVPGRQEGRPHPHRGRSRRAGGQTETARPDRAAGQQQIHRRRAPLRRSRCDRRLRHRRGRAA